MVSELFIRNQCDCSEVFHLMTETTNSHYNDRFHRNLYDTDGAASVSARRGHEATGYDAP
jgi:hypothetical protein